MLPISNSPAVESNGAVMKNLITIERMVGLGNIRHLAVQLGTLGDLPGILANGAQHVGVYDHGTDAALLVWALKPGPLQAQTVLVLGLVALAGLVVGVVGPQREVSDIQGLGASWSRP